MSVLAGAVVSAFSTGKSPLPMAATGFAVGGTLFFGGSTVEDLSYVVADACFTEDSNIHTVAKKVVSVFLEAFAVFTVVNLGASALALSWAVPLPFLGAVVSSIFYEIFADRPKNLTKDQKMSMGSLTEDGKHVTVKLDQNKSCDLPLFSLTGEPIQESISQWKRWIKAKVRDIDGEVLDVIVTKGIVYTTKPPISVGQSIGQILGSNKAVITRGGNAPIWLELCALDGGPAPEPISSPYKPRFLKLIASDGSFRDVVVANSTIYLRSSGDRKPVYLGKKIGTLSKDKEQIDFIDGSTSLDVDLSQFSYFDIKSCVFVATLAPKGNGEERKVYYHEGDFYEIDKKK